MTKFFANLPRRHHFANIESSTPDPTQHDRPPDSALYNVPDAASRKRQKQVHATSSSASFNSTLSSLLATSASQPKPPRTRVTKPKDKRDDIFSQHNRNTAKRAAADDDNVYTQKHSTTSVALDAGEYKRSRRKMEEKARLYAAMKRGDYVPSGVDREAEGLVDFDRKWADEPPENHSDSDPSYPDSEAGAPTADPDEQIEYEDEFGRLRKGTRRDAAKLARQRAAAAYASEQLSSFSARPTSRPDNLIVGDAVQSAAFAPDAVVLDAMDALARKRDRSLTPPEAVHYDASKEIRSKGVGFYQFSRDESKREQEMGNLQAERAQTARLQRQREEAREKKSADMTGRHEADSFLAGLDVQVPRTGFVREERS